jgi:hypothetical protein
MTKLSRLKFEQTLWKPRSSGLVVSAEDSRPRGHGFESRRILDGCGQCLVLHIPVFLNLFVLAEHLMLA